MKSLLIVACILLAAVSSVGCGRNDRNEWTSQSQDVDARAASTRAREESVLATASACATHPKTPGCQVVLAAWDAWVGRAMACKSQNLDVCFSLPPSEPELQRIAHECREQARTFADFQAENRGGITIFNLQICEAAIYGDARARGIRPVFVQPSASLPTESTIF